MNLTVFLSIPSQQEALKIELDNVYVQVNLTVFLSIPTQQEALKIEPDNVYARVNLTVFLLNSGDLLGASRQYQETDKIIQEQLKKGREIDSELQVIYV